MDPILLNDRFKQCDKIVLNKHNNRSQLLLTQYTLFLLLLSFFGFLNYKSNFNLSIVSATIIFSIFYLFLSGLIIKQFAFAYIKGDTFVLTYINGKQSKVMNVSCVRSTSTSQLFGLFLTRVTFKLDGRKQTATLLGRSEYSINPAEIITQAKHIAA